LAITYIGQIPKSVAYSANSLLGRLILFILTVTIADTYSWVYGLLMALFVVLIIAVSPRSYQEGFGNSRESSDIDTEIKLVTQKRKWWSEEILQENPLGIEEEKVKTQAIQDNSNTNSSTNSSK
jgi:c-di-AMP phosphodiesterase-like protein